MQQRWRAWWRTKNGTLQELFFSSEDNRMLARLDFQLKLMDLKCPVPDVFELDEQTLLIPPVPRLSVLVPPKRRKHKQGEGRQGV